MLAMLLASAGICFAVNRALPTPVVNFMLIGMSFSTVFANMVPKEKLDGMMKVMNPVIGFAMIVVILNLAAPLDYHLIFGAGLYTAIYIVARAVGKYGGAYFGAAVTHAPETVRKSLGFTLLPHSGVSLVFTGIAGVGCCRPPPGVRPDHPGHHRGGSRHQRNHPRSSWPRRALRGAGELHKAERRTSSNEAAGAPGAQQA